ncbi:hypothetical protein HV213_15625 [Klebsiella sp. RHBSTW-00484]|uniref:hypothetical protein n=1 Tax=unclassified Klebsiella TaxID=2608929 RepID=UPI0015E54249|nr:MULTISPECIES: hypothetical protein [unclassified Klebsiella]MBA7846942.1 hypothetical protein [Klebsiella sp. RHBSTW-00465]QLO37147.1 hypothetical protein HV213_15625 [Klebsiella sp. RHBSTW-00484]QLT76665.1 hypothetical protein HV204_15625 [Klebsiella sp. RHBSTW-00464]
MATESDNVTIEADLQYRLLQHTLASWRYLLLFATPPLLWAMFIAPPGVMRAVIVLLCGIVFFGCWRIWLDARYFTLITQENNDQAGEALAFIWRRARLRELTFIERQQGALKQLRRTLMAVAATWMMWILALMF